MKEENNGMGHTWQQLWAILREKSGYCAHEGDCIQIDSTWHPLHYPLPKAECSDDCAA